MARVRALRFHPEREPKGLSAGCCLFPARDDLAPLAGDAAWALPGRCPAMLGVSVAGPGGAGWGLFWGCFGLSTEVISRLGTEPSSAATVAAAMRFVEPAGGRVVAEGIEEQRMLTALLDPGRSGPAPETVLAGQGYLLGRPAPRPEGLDTHLPVLDKHPSRPELEDLDAGTAIHGKGQ